MKRSTPMPLIVAIIAIVLLFVASQVNAGDAAARLKDLKKTDTPRATWQQSSGSVATAAPKLYLVTETYCGPCQSLKRNLKSAGIEYSTLSVAEMRKQFNRTVSSIPYLFYIRSDGQRVGRYGGMSVAQVKDFARPTLALTTAPSPARTTCTITGSRGPSAIIDALITHVAVEAGAELPMSGMADIHIPLNTKISDALVLLSHKQQISIGRFVSARWKDLSITSSKGRTVFNSPVVVEGKALGVTITATLREIYLHEDGRTLDVVVDGLPDLRLVFTE